MPTPRSQSLTLILGAFLTTPNLAQAQENHEAPPLKPFQIEIPPLSVIKFDDGTILEVFQASIEKINLGITKQPKDWSRNWHHSAGGLGTDANHLEIGTYSSDDNIMGHTWNGQPTSLLFLCRILDPKGKPFRPTRFSWGLKTKGAIEPDNDLETPPLWSDMQKAKPGNAHLPECLVQIQDSDGSWINADGPVCDEGSGLGVLTFRTWPRSLKTLQFRAIMPGRSPVSWSIPNPVHPVTPEKWELSETPIQITKSDFELTFNRLNLLPGRTDVATIDFDFQSTHFGDETVGVMQRSWDAKCVGIQGSLGGYYQQEFYYLRKNRGVSAFKMPADETLLKISIEVKPTPDHRYPRIVSTPLLSGLISKDGRSIELLPHDLKKHGLTEARVSLGNDDEEPVTWDMVFEWADQASAAAAKKNLLLEEGQLVCFLNEEEFSVGFVDENRSASTRSGKKSSIERSYRWSGIPTKVVEENTTSYFNSRPQPGTKVTLAVVRPRAPQVFSFVVPRPE